MSERGGKLSRSSRSYWIRSPIDAWLRQEGAGAGGARVLDVGSGDGSYAAYFPAAAEYVGFDIPDNPRADVHGYAESLPLPDESFDVVLCIQVLEHVDDPAAVVRELRRVVRPGGRVLASTHGTQVYHPSPADHWRWTATGLERLFASAGAWDSVTVEPGAGTGATLAMLISTYVDLAADAAHVPFVGRALIRAINAAGGAIDRRSERLRTASPGSLIGNFHVTAVR
jgi:SAM-dependent methyltransferase